MDAWCRRLSRTCIAGSCRLCGQKTLDFCDRTRQCSTVGTLVSVVCLQVINPSQTDHLGPETIPQDRNDTVFRE